MRNALSGLYFKILVLCIWERGTSVPKEGVKKEKRNRNVYKPEERAEQRQAFYEATLWSGNIGGAAN